MEATQNYPNLLSEKQAAKRLGVARITLLRAREAGRIRFFRIGTRVLYCAEQLTEFLNGCGRPDIITWHTQRGGLPTSPPSLFRCRIYLEIKTARYNAPYGGLRPRCVVNTKLDATLS